VCSACVLVRTRGGGGGGQMTGNIRANMYFYKNIGDKAPGNAVVLQDTGDAGAYNRANRSVHHMIENFGAVVAGFGLVGGALVCVCLRVSFPLPRACVLGDMHACVHAGMRRRGMHAVHAQGVRMRRFYACTHAHTQTSRCACMCAVLCVPACRREGVLRVCVPVSLSGREHVRLCVCVWARGRAKSLCACAPVRPPVRPPVRLRVWASGC